MMFRNWQHNLGDGTATHRGDNIDEMGDNLVAVDLGTDFIPRDVEAGWRHVCAISESNAVKCWGQLMLSILIKIYCLLISPQCTGDNDDGQLGIGCLWTRQFGDDLPALDFGNEFIPKMMGLGYGHSCFVSTKWSMICFGVNSVGQVILYLKLLLYKHLLFVVSIL